MPIRTMILALWPALALAGHPLVSDDTGVQGAGQWQYELNTDQGVYRGQGGDTRADQYNTTLTYGLNEHADIALNLPYSSVRPAGAVGTNGVGDASLAIKWCGYTNGGLSLALKPQLNLLTGDKDKGLGNGRAGAGMNGLLAYQAGSTTVLANAGLTWNANAIGARQSLWNGSLALTYAATSTLSLVFDTGVYRNADAGDNRDPAFVLAGLVWSPSQQLDLDVGYKHGLNHAEVDHSVGAGLTLHF